MYEFNKVTDITYTEIRNLFRLHLDETCTILQIQIAVGVIVMFVARPSVENFSVIVDVGMPNHFIGLCKWFVPMIERSISLPFAFSLGRNDGVQYAASHESHPWCQFCTQMTIGATLPFTMRPLPNRAKLTRRCSWWRTEGTCPGCIVSATQFPQAKNSQELCSTTAFMVHFTIPGDEGFGGA